MPAECEFGITKHDRGYIEQSDLIEELRARVKKLEQKLNEHNGVVSQGTIVTTNYGSNRLERKTNAVAVDAQKETVSGVCYRGVQSYLVKSNDFRYFLQLAYEKRWRDHHHPKNSFWRFSLAR